MANLDDEIFQFADDNGEGDAYQETGDGSGASKDADEDVKNDEAGDGAGVQVFELEGGTNGALYNLLVQATQSINADQENGD